MKIVNLEESRNIKFIKDIDGHIVDSYPNNHSFYILLQFDDGDSAKIEVSKTDYNIVINKLNNIGI
jgi:hypothetical protein